jgi:hypothetical protein
MFSGRPVPAAVPVPAWPEALDGASAANDASTAA